MSLVDDKTDAILSPGRQPLPLPPKTASLNYIPGVQVTDRFTNQLTVEVEEPVVYHLKDFLTRAPQNISNVNMRQNMSNPTVSDSERTTESLSSDGSTLSEPIAAACEEQYVLDSGGRIEAYRGIDMAALTQSLSALGQLQNPLDSID